LTTPTSAKWKVRNAWAMGCYNLKGKLRLQQKAKTWGR
jgi:hypothetical protein